MKITHEMKGTTVGQMATFLAHALGNGVGLDDPIVMHRGRASDIIDISIELTLPGFETPSGAAGELSGGPRAPRSTRAGRATRGGNATPEPAADPAAAG